MKDITRHVSLADFLLFMLEQLTKLHPEWTKKAIEAEALALLHNWWTTEYPDYPQPGP